MKKNKLAVVVMTAFFVLPCFAGNVHAADDAKAQQEKIVAKRAELNDHEWNIKVIPAADKTKITEDTLIFKDQMFEAKGMTAKGYKPTNYTVSLQEGGPTVWETMQSLDGGNAIFWRGEWEGERMNGVMSKQLGEGKDEVYYFSSLSSKVIEKAPEPVKEEPVAAVADDVAESTKATAEVPAAVVEEVKKEVAPTVEKAAAPAVKEAKKEAPKKKKWGF